MKKISRKAVEKRKKVFASWDREVLEDIVNGCIANADEIAIQAAKELLGLE